MWKFIILSGSSNKPKVGLIVGIIAGFTVALLLVGVLFFLCKGRYKGYKREEFVDVAGKFCAVIGLLMWIMQFKVCFFCDKNIYAIFFGSI